MGRVHVAHFETGALAGQAARSKGRHAALVGQFRQRVLLVHELRELRGAEEFAHRGSHRLGVDQVMRHHGVDIDSRHAFLDGALHAQQADAELVFHQLAHRTHAAVAEIVNVVDFAAAVTQFDQRLEDSKDVFLAQNAHRVGRVQAHAHVHLHAANRRQVITFAVEEQLAEQGFGGVQRRRFARAHDAIDVDQRLLAAVVLVDVQRIADVGADIDAVDVQHFHVMEARFQNGRQIVGGQFVTGFNIDFAGFRIDHVQRAIAADHFVRAEGDVLDAVFAQLAQGAHGDLGTGFQHHVAGLGVLPVRSGLGVAHPAGVERGGPATVLVVLEGNLAEEIVQDFFLGQT